jgi:hypothetical protein
LLYPHGWRAPALFPIKGAADPASAISQCRKFRAPAESFDSRGAPVCWNNGTNAQPGEWLAGVHSQTTSCPALFCSCRYRSSIQRKYRGPGSMSDAQAKPAALTRQRGERFDVIVAALTAVATSASFILAILTPPNGLYPSRRPVDVPGAVAGAAVRHSAERRARTRGARSKTVRSRRGRATMAARAVQLD